MRIEKIDNGIRMYAMSLDSVKPMGCMKGLCLTMFLSRSYNEALANRADTCTSPSVHTSRDGE